MASEPVTDLRYKRQIETAHPDAFLLMRYRSRDGLEMMVWNSRDGECPSRFTYDGREYHYRNQTNALRSTIIPDRADLVVTSYTRQQWAEWSRISWEASCKRDPSYRTKTPTAEAFLNVAPFEYGMPRIISRHQFLAETNEWQGRLGK